jgi:hypothetical protein
LYEEAERGEGEGQHDRKTAGERWIKEWEKRSREMKERIRHKEGRNEKEGREKVAEGGSVLHYNHLMISLALASSFFIWKIYIGSRGATGRKRR